MSDNVNFVRVDLDPKAQGRKLRYKHRDLRDVVKESGKPIGELFQDAFFGWPYLLLYGLRWQDLQLNLDKCSEFIDYWVEKHADEKYPMQSLGEKILEALNKSGFVKIEAEGTLEEPEGNGLPEDSIR